MAVYVICAPGAGQHYVGSTADARLADRLAEHANGRGARIVAAWRARGIDYHLVKLWRRWGRGVEERLKARHRHADFCPRCARAEGRRPSSPLRVRIAPGSEWARRARKHGRPLAAEVILRNQRRDARRGRVA